MKVKSVSIPLLGSLYLLVGVVPNVIASTASEQALMQKVEQISRHAEQLQKEMESLKAELRALKQERQQEQPKLAAKKPVDKSVDNKPIDNKSTSLQEATITGPVTASIVPTVTTSPYIGLRSAFDATDLVVNVPTMGEDLRLLRERQSLKKKLGGALPFQDRPVIVISGKLEPIIYARRDYVGTHFSDIDLNSAELDFLVEGSPWALGFFSITSNDVVSNAALSNSTVSNRVLSTVLYLKRGFITIGNLDQSPFYLSAGQMYVNFGRYASALVTPALTQILGQTNERQIQIGYAGAEGFSMSGYAFKGDAFTGNPNSINEGGVNARYIKDFGNDRAISLGAGYISNIADSTGIQITALPYPRQGFAIINDVEFIANELLVRRAPAMNAHAEFSFGRWTLMGEYVGTVRAFDVSNFSFNGYGASPKAMHLELNRKFSIFDKPANISVAYGHSWQALAVGLPTNKYSFVFNFSPVKNTVLSIEYSRFKNYMAGTTAYVKGADVPLIPSFAPFVSPGGYTNLILAQLGLYF